MADDDSGQYRNQNRAFLQAFIARSTLTFEEAKPLIAAIQTVHDKRERLAEDVTEADLNGFIATANNAISPFDLEIRSTFHQLTRARTYALINSTSDALTQMATVHTPDEIGFLKRILDAMFETYNTPRHEIMAITSMQAMSLAKPPAESRRATQNGTDTQGSAGQGLTMVQAEKMLRSLVEEGWFEKSRKGFYSLSPRALMELRGWLFETYNDVDEDEDETDSEGKRIKTCMGCKEIITAGQRCAQRSCPCRLHDICVQQFFRTQDSRSCPTCHTEWTGKDFVGERAVAGSKEKPRNRGRDSGTRRQRSSLVGGQVGEHGRESVVLNGDTDRGSDNDEDDDEGATD